VYKQEANLAALSCGTLVIPKAANFVKKIGLVSSQFGGSSSWCLH
jgi:hypothetical protein